MPILPRTSPFADRTRSCRSVTVGEIIEALADGLRDFQSAPIYGLTFGALYAAGGILIVLSLSALGASYLPYPLAAGFALIGPFVAVGLYEVSRRRETGQPLSWTAVIGTIVTQGWRELGWMAFVTVFVFVIWMYLIQLLIALLLGLKSFVSLGDFLLAVTTTPESWIFLIDRAFDGRCSIARSVGESIASPWSRSRSCSPNVCPAHAAA